MRVHELESHAALEPAVVGLVDRGHAATGHPVDDLVARVDEASDNRIRDHAGSLRVGEWHGVTNALACTRPPV